MTIRKRTLRNATARAVLDVVADYGGRPERGALILADRILAAQRAHDRDMRTLRIQQGLAAKRLKEAHLFYAGTRPYGWRSVGHGQLEPHPAEQLVIEWMLRQRAQGYPWRSLVERLNEAGTPTPKGGARWSIASVRRIVNRGRDYRPPDSKVEWANEGFNRLQSVRGAPAADANR